MRRPFAFAVGAVAALIAGLAGLGASASPGASAAAPELWRVNGDVKALTVSGNLVYVGGDFTRISPHTGPVVAVSAGSGARLTFPSIADGSVRAIVDDGRGGWFVGGSFAGIGGFACKNLVHVTSRRSVDRTWCPKSGEVAALARRGSRLYVGGERTLAALDARTGRLVKWNPRLEGSTVWDLAIHGRTVYVLGHVGQVGGKPHGYLSAVDALTGKIEPWDPDPPSDDRGDALMARIAASDSVVYAGGATLVAYDRRTSKQTSWKPAPNSWVTELALEAGRLYVGGSFTRIAAKPVRNLASFDSGTGRLTPWRPRSAPVGAFSINGSKAYVAADDGLVSFDARTGKRLPWKPPQPDGGVSALGVTPSAIVVGGGFSGVGGVIRNGVAALDLRTGKPTAWDPRLSGGVPHEAVYTVTVQQGTVYVGGLFGRARGVPRTALAAVNAATGEPTAWHPVFGRRDPVAYSTSVSGSTLYVAGTFETVDGLPRNGWAAFDTNSGRLTEWRPVAVANAYIGSPVVAEGPTVFVGSTSVVAVDGQTGNDVIWEVPLEISRVPSVETIAVSSGVVYFGGFFETAAGVSRKALAAVNTATGKLTPWAPGTDEFEFPRALLVDSSVVYIGSFAGLRAVDRTTGRLVRSYPTLSEKDVNAIAVVGNRVFAGGEFGLVSLPAA